ncbi:hypothetical protein [Streptomyces eurythermus]
MQDQPTTSAPRGVITQPVPSRWRTTWCADCDDEIEVDQFGWKTVCSCLAVH